MRRMRWLAWLANLLLLVTITAVGAHSHHGLAQEGSCSVCTIAHAPGALPPNAPTPRAPEPTRVVVAVTALENFDSPLSTIPSPRGPPLG